MTFQFKNVYVCSGHYHHKDTHLMVNPFSMEVMPDQWCQGSKPANFIPATKTSVPTERVKRMSEALWCKIGKHAFDPDDEGAEEYTRTVKVKDRYGDLRNEVKTFSVCSEHLNTPFQPEPKRAINGETISDTGPSNN